MSRRNLDEYHLFNNEVGRKFDNFITNEMDNRCDANTVRFLYQKFFEKKLGTAHQRVTQVFIAAKLFEIDTEKYSDELLRLSAVAELLIWSEYAFNWVTDEKNNDSGTKYEENCNLITSQYLLTEAVYFLPDRMLKRYLELYRWGIYGCLTVERDLRITNWEAMRDDQIFWNAYSDNHCIPDVGALYAYCFELVINFFEIQLDKTITDTIFRIGVEFGRGIQINGDLSDFMIPNDSVATTEKRAQKDYFIDIRTDRLTYPTWLLLKCAENDNPLLFKSIMDSAKNRAYPDESFFFTVHKFMEDQGIVRKVLGFLTEEEKRLVQEVQKIPGAQDGINLWVGSIAILTHNKFRRQLEEDYSLTGN